MSQDGSDIQGLDIEALGKMAVDDPELLARVVEATADEDRRLRQKAASVLFQVSKSNPELLVPFASDLAEALHRPEAKTRWEILDTLCALIPIDARSTDRAVAGAEASLYDEDSGPARLAAFRFLATYGSTTENRAERVWPLIDEALQCYHGDPEFHDMLSSVYVFAGGKAGRDVKKKLVARMKFDAENSRGPLGRRAKEIIAIASGK